MIQNVQFLNFKGHSATVDLAPCTFIHGPNRSNKTTVIDALLVALLGYHPDAPRTNAGVFGFASASSMAVEVVFDAPVAGVERVTRRLTAGSSAIKAELTPKGYTLDPRLAVALDSSLYFGRTETERINLVTALIETGSAKREEIVAKLKQVRLTDHTEAAEKALTGLLEVLPAQQPDQSAQAWLDVVAEWLKAKAKEAAAQVKTLDATARGLTDMNVVESMLAALRSLGDYDAEIQQGEKTLGELRTRAGRLEAAAKAAVANTSRRMQIERELEELPAVLTPEARAETEKALADARAAHTEARAAVTKAREAVTEASNARTRAESAVGNDSRELRDIDGQLARFGDLPAPPSAEERAQAEAGLEQARKDLADAEAQVVRAGERIREIMAGNGSQSGRIESSQREIAKLDDEIKALESAECCPTCKTKREGWQNTARKLMTTAREEHAQALHLAESALEQGKRDLADYTAAEARLREDVRVAKAAIDTVTRQLATWKEADAKAPLLERRAARAAAIEAGRKTYGEAQAAEDEARRALANACASEENVLGQIATAEHELADGDRAARDRATLTAELARLNAAAGSEEVDDAARDVVATEIEAAEGQLAALRAERDKRKGLEHDKQRIAAAQEAASSAKVEVEIIKAAAEKVRDIKAELTAEAMRPVLEVANRILAGFMVLDFEAGMVGRRADGRFIPHTTFSGSEKRLTVAAIVAGLAARAPLRLFVLDEFDTVDEVNKPKILRNLALAVEQGVLDQVLVVGLTNVSATQSGWRVIAA